MHVLYGQHMITEEAYALNVDLNVGLIGLITFLVA